MHKFCPYTSAFDPGYDPVTLESHLDQSSHLISVLKISMACWQIASESATKSKIDAARLRKLEVCAGGGPFEVAAHFGKLQEFMELCAQYRFTRIEAGEGFTNTNLDPRKIVRKAREFGLDVQFELGKKHEGAFPNDKIGELINRGKEWLDAGALQVVIEGRESAKCVGLFDDYGKLNTEGAERFLKEFGTEATVFEAPNKSSQFALLDYFGPEIHLSNVRLEEILRVEIYRRGLHSDAFRNDNLRPKGPHHK